MQVGDSHGETFPWQLSHGCSQLCYHIIIAPCLEKNRASQHYAVSPETITTLLIGYTPIPNKKLTKQNKTKQNTEVLLKKSQERILVGLTVATCLALVATTVAKEGR